MAGCHFGVVEGEGFRWCGGWMGIGVVMDGEKRFECGVVWCGLVYVRGIVSPEPTFENITNE